MIISITNQKGGVGKTTLSINLSYALASLGYRVLVIDMDPQGNCTDGLGIDTNTLEKTIYDVLIDEEPLANVVVPHAQDGLFVVPANMALFGAEAELSTEISRPFKLRQAVKSESYKYDFIFIDCPPNLGVLTVNAIMASTDILVPIEPNSYALKGMSVLMNTLLIVQNDMEHYPNFLGVAVNMYEKSNELHETIVRNIDEFFPNGKVFNSKINREAIIAEAEINGQSIVEYRPDHNAAQLFIQLAKEIQAKNNERAEKRKAKAAG